MENGKKLAIAMAIALVVNLTLVLFATAVISSEIHWLVLMISATLLSVVAVRKGVKIGKEEETPVPSISLLIAILIVWNLTPEHYDYKTDEWTVVCRFILPFVWVLVPTICLDDYKKSASIMKVVRAAFAICAVLCFVGCFLGFGNTPVSFHIVGILTAISGSIGCLFFAYDLWRN